MFELGDHIVDTVTGFTGIVTARCEYLGEETRIQVTSRQIEKGKPPAEIWINEKRAKKDASVEDFT